MVLEPRLKQRAGDAAIAGFSSCKSQQVHRGAQAWPHACRYISNMLRYAQFSSLIAALAILGCSHKNATQPAEPPDARRPEMRSQAELSAEQQAAMDAGQITPTSIPVLEQERPKLGPATASSKPLPPIPTSPDAIESDILMVNDASLSVSEVLYMIRGELRQARESQTTRGFIERVERLTRENARREVGTLLLYEKAYRELNDMQKKSLDVAIDREVERRIGTDFNGSKARFQKHLLDYGLTQDQFRERVRRQLLVSQYTREMLLPKIQVRRDELLAYYKANAEHYATAGTRELLLIEMPFEKFLPESQPWNGANERAQAAAKLAALRKCRAAHEALQQQAFADVAREFSQGLNAAQGGSWGPIGAPLQAPYDQVSKLIFDYAEGQHSEPLECGNAYVIVGCGRIVPAKVTPFLEVQEQVRTQLIDERFNHLANEYVMRLAEKATLSSLDAFVQAAVKKATSPEFTRINSQPD